MWIARFVKGLRDHLVWFTNLRFTEKGDNLKHGFYVCQAIKEEAADQPLLCVDEAERVSFTELVKYPVELLNI